MTHSQHQLDDDAASDEFPDEPLDDAVLEAEEGGDADSAPEVAAVLESVDELKKVLAAELSTDTTQHS